MLGAAPATSSKNYVFYASNPDYNVFDAYFEYCSKPAGELGKFGLLITSSYGPIRIYRVSAYVRCSAYSCGANLVRSIDLDGFSSDYDSKCSGEFNTSVTHLEYLNEDNIAVVVTSSPVSTFDRDTLRFTNASTAVYWLNPATMRLSSSIWQTILPTSNAGSLCPSMQRFPRVGSFLAELANSAVYLVEYVIKVPMNFPGMIPIWAAGGRCPQQSYGHAMLATCGADILSLDNVFDALCDAQSIFWHTLSLVASMIQV
jgi:hypothetical protein